MPNEIDTLMSLDPLELSAQDIDAIIAYHRKGRALFESGVKPKRDGVAAPSLEEIGLTSKPAPLKRRKL
jgi:hypothetical protein